MEFLVTLITNIFKKSPVAKNEDNRHAKRDWKKHQSTFSFSKIVLIASIVFLFVPLLVIVVYSFWNPEADGTIAENAPLMKKISYFLFHDKGVSLRWYKDLFTSSGNLWISIVYSAIVAVVSALLSTIIGSLAAIGNSWYKFFGRSYIQTVSFLPMVLPEVIMGVSLLIFLTGIGMDMGFVSIIIAHTTFCLPFVYLMVSARVDEFDYSIIEASHDLGANEKQTLTKVIIPAIFPGIMSGFMMSITLSIEDFVITSLVNGDVITLPIYVMNQVKTGVSPVINAFSLVLILAIGALLVITRKNLKGFAASH